VELGHEIQRKKTPISQLETIILDRLIQLETRLNPKPKNGTTLNLRRRIHAFREGFAGKHFPSDVRYYFLFREAIFSKIVPFGLLFVLGFILAVILADTTLPADLSNLTAGQQQILSARNLLIGSRGGMIAIALLFFVPLAFFIGSRWLFAHYRRRNYQRTGYDAQPVAQQEMADGKRLSEIFDDYLADGVAIAAKNAIAGMTAADQSELGERFSDGVAARMARLRAEESDAQLFNEVKDLGRSFRRYYLRFTLENADVDLPFIPNSVKQSLAVLIRRSKTSAKQAEDQIIHLKAEVEAWYDRSMERASGVYRRNAKGISILIGVFLAIAVNANSIHILDQLAFEEELRLTLRETVQQSFEDTTAAEDGDLQTVMRAFREEVAPELDEINLPIGWDPYLINEEFDCNMPRPSTAPATSNPDNPVPDPDQSLASEAAIDPWHQLIQACIYGQDRASQPIPPVTDGQTTADMAAETAAASIPTSFFYPTAIASIFLQKPLVGLRYLLGWIITGIAISMGASFWFDLLGKLVKVRNTGKPIPTTSQTTEEPDVSAAATLKEE
jgi:hypothetical protein